MKSSAIVCAIAAASLSLGSLSASAQGRVRDPNASNNPEIYRQTHPEDPAGALNLQGPSHPRWDNRGGREHQHRNDRRDERRSDRRDDRRDHRDHRDHHGYRYQAPQWQAQPHAPHYSYDYGHRGTRYYYGARSPEFRRGAYIPRAYYSPQYYVSDWRGHQLYAPPYGHQWVQVGSDYVLIALATGLIVNLLLNQ